MRYLRRTPTPGSWRRKLVASFLVLVTLPLLLSVALVAAGQVVQVIDQIVDAVWPWAVGVAVIVLLWRLIIRRF